MSIVVANGAVVFAGGGVISVGSSAIDAVWIPPTTNTDGSTITQGEITGYQMGIRSSGSAGTYPLIVEMDGPYQASALLAGIIPGLSPGTYFAAIRSIGPTDSAWSPENTFVV